MHYVKSESGERFSPTWRRRASFAAAARRCCQLLGLIGGSWATLAGAQPLAINPVTINQGKVAVTFPTRSDSYYWLQASPTPNGVWTPVSAELGSGGPNGFSPATSTVGSVFYRVEQLSLTSTNCILSDGVPDGWKLLNGLSPLTPGLITNAAFGYSTSWGWVYSNQMHLASLPVAYFPNSTTTVVIGETNVSVPVSLTKPYTGWLTYQLSGTAIPKATGVTGDYIPPNIPEVYVANSTTANITLNLVPETDIEINRSIVIALSAPPEATQNYAIATNTCVTTVQVMQSTHGVYVGTLTITNGLFSGSQSVKLAIRPGTGGSTVAFLDVTGNSLLGNTFAVPVSIGTNGFQLNGGTCSNTVTSTPWGRNILVNLSFGATQFTNVTSSSLGGQTSYGAAYITPVAMTLGGLTASGLTYTGNGTLNLTQSQ